MKSKKFQDKECYLDGKESCEHDTPASKVENLRTPTPLYVMYDNDNCRSLVMRGDVLIADCGKGSFGKSEASRIVRAVNAHEELLAALKDAYELIDLEGRHKINGSAAVIHRNAYLAIAKAEVSDAGREPSSGK